MEQMNDIDLIDDICYRLEDEYIKYERNLDDVASVYGRSDTVAVADRDQFLNSYKADSTVYWFLDDIDE